MKILVAGDFCDKGRVSDYIKRHDYASLFDDIKPLVDSCDIRIVNFEFPIVKDVANPIPKCGPNLIGQVEALEAVKYAGFNVCTLANNHILDQGESCCLETKKLLENANVRTVGVGKNIDEASDILYIQHDGQTLAVINCCEHEFSIATSHTAGANPLNPVQQFYKIKEARIKADYVLVIVHGGHEHYQLPSPRMKELYRFYIDSGADAVVNHHQHCFSGYEIYKEHPIFYGLGNLCFDGNSSDKTLWYYGYMVEILFDKAKGPRFQLHPYVQCKEHASVNLLHGEEKQEIIDEVEKLNEIISNDKRLVESFQEWSESRKSSFDMSLAPYNNRWLLALWRRGLIPSFTSKIKLLKLLNNVDCESHKDTFVLYLNKKSQE